MPEVFVGAGSNSGPERALQLAVTELTQRFGTVRCSRVYRSPAAGERAPDYLNLVVAMSTELDVDAVREALRAVETRAGRTRTNPTVTELDLDLLVYGACVDASRRLPRPGLFTTPFIVGPLAELAPELVHPVTGESCRAAWELCVCNDLRDVGELSSLR